jgi:D-amino-acid dehydrogenase
MSHVAVIGAGVVGVASAYLLCRAGHRVTLIDRHAGPALANSHRNGAQLSYGYCDALASPGLLRSFPAILLGRDPAYRVRLQTDPEFLIWGLRFFANGVAPRFLANTRYLLELAANSATILQSLLSEFELAFDYQVAGKMILYSSAVQFRNGEPIRRLKQNLGILQEKLNYAEASAIEPSLLQYQGNIVQVLYNPNDAVGCPDQFCTALVNKLKSDYGLATEFGHDVKRLIVRKDRIAAIAFATRQQLECDAVVVATAFIPSFLPWQDRSMGRVWPVRGYSITGMASDAAMQISITDLKRKLVFARIGDELRIAGLADIGSREPEFQDERLRALKSLSLSAFGIPIMTTPNNAVSAWAGNRPCTPSSRPIISRGQLAGLYLNVGHGTLGWTLGLGSAQKLISIMSEDLGR